MLDQFIPQSVGIHRQRAFRTFGVQELVWLVGGLVDGRTTDLCEPDRFRFRDPLCRGGLPNTADPIMMRLGPPVADILVAVNPRLSMRAICDRLALLQIARLG